MNSEKISYGIVGLVGILAVVMSSVSWLFAATIDPSWIFGTNMVSDLGVSDVSLTCTLFNYGMCLAGGIVTGLFGLLLALKENDFAGRIFGILTLFGAVCLVFIGLVHSGESYHLSIASALAIFALFAVLAITLGDIKDQRYLIGGTECILLILLVFFCFTASSALAEAYGIIASAIVIFMQSVKYIFKKA